MAKAALRRASAMPRRRGSTLGTKVQERDLPVAPQVRRQTAARLRRDGRASVEWSGHVQQRGFDQPEPRKRCTRNTHPRSGMALPRLAGATP